MDTAYLNASIDADFYITLPQNFEVPSQGELNACKLSWAICGLKQAELACSNHLSSLLLILVYRKSKHDPYLFVKGKKNQLLIATKVDDLELLRNYRDVMNIKDKLEEILQINRLGDINYLLGWKFTVEGEAVRISHPSYIQKILLKFDMKRCNTAPTPADPGQANKSNKRAKMKFHFLTENSSEALCG